MWRLQPRVQQNSRLYVYAAFHEAFHAVARFAKAAGALSEADIAELARKYRGAGAGPG